MSTYNWIYNGHDINSISDIQVHCPNVWGFVYLLTLRDKKSGKVSYQYIGKKNLYSKRKRNFGKKESAKLADKRKKKYEYVIKESDWKVYISSNKFIKENYKDYDIYREILILCTNDNDLTYQEAKHIICSDALENPAYLNDGVSIRRFGKKLIN